MKKFLFIFALGFLLVPALLRAAGIEIPEGDGFTALLALVKDWSTLAPLAKGAASIVVFVQLVKKFMPAWEYTRVTVVVGGILWGLLNSMALGMSVVDAAVYAFISCGGAVALYELFKPVAKIVPVPFKG